MCGIFGPMLLKVVKQNLNILSKIFQQKPKSFQDSFLLVKFFPHEYDAFIHSNLVRSSYYHINLLSRVGQCRFKDVCNLKAFKMIVMLRMVAQRFTNLNPSRKT